MKRTDEMKIPHKEPLIMTRSMTFNHQRMRLRREASFDQGNFNEKGKSVEDCLTDLDSLVISTTGNVSRKLCQMGSRILKHMNRLVPEEEEDMMVTMETVGYLLDDTEQPTTVSAELAGKVFTIRNTV